jgi:hypothetical protein
MAALTTNAIQSARRQRGLIVGGAALAGVSVEQLEWQAQAMVGVFQWGGWQPRMGYVMI